MLKNYLLTSVRSLRKQKLYTAINLVSLAFGLAISLTGLSYVVYEFTWEDCHENHNRIHRIEATYTHGDTLVKHARMMAPLGRTVAREIPGVKAVAGFRRSTYTTIEVDRVEYQVGQMLQAGPEFFDVFTVSLKTGDPAVALRDPYSVLISDSLARLCFPGQSPIGRVIQINDDRQWQVTGVLDDISKHTQVHTNLIGSYATLASAGYSIDSWDSIGTDLTYLLLEDGVNPAVIETQVRTLAARYLPDNIVERYAFRLKPLDEIYFETYFSGNQGELYPGGEWEIIYMLSAIALFVLIQAIANFINLSTARASDRTKEVGIRKTFGAERPHLMRQFLSESILLTITAAFFGLAFYEFFRQGLQRLLPGQELASLYERWDLGLLAVALVGLVGVAAGYYPALHLSRFRPIAVLQGAKDGKGSRSLLRRGLVVFQFTLAIIFVISTVIIYRQQTFVFETDLGFDKDNVLVLRFDDDQSAETRALLVNELRERNVALGVTRCNVRPGTRFGRWWLWRAPGREDSTRFYAKVFNVDHDFLTTFGLEVSEGRWFESERPEDINHAVLINESMVEKLGIARPLGYRIYRDSTDFVEVVGVVKDFHGASLDFFYESNHVIMLNPDRTRYVLARLPGGDIAGSVRDVGEIWRRVLPDQEFTYTFLDEDIRTVYSEMDEMIGVFGVLAIISIGIACLGIFGLVSYMAQQRTKEIGIRKVLGASVAKIVLMLAREFLVLIVLANLIAWPLAYLFMRAFLQEFPFRISLGVGTFASGGVLALALALLTSGYQSFRAARANPVEALKYE